MTIKRYQYVSYIENTVSEDARKSDRITIAEHIKNGNCLTVAAYEYGHMIFLYFEALTEDISPEMLFPELTKALSDTPNNNTFVKWKPLTNVYYTHKPESAESLAREGKKTRIGKIAYLYPEKIPSYIYYHKALTDEGLYFGDKYLFISLVDNILFAYCEEPNIITHIKSDIDEPSSVIEEWQKQNPRSHFDRSLTDGENNFLILSPLLTIGKEDI